MAPDENDYKKLARVMRYEADNLQLVKWWIGGAFATHRDMLSNTGRALSLGKGVITGVSTQQKLMTRISTCYFFEAQGYGVDDVIIYQYNKSTMLLEQNGRASSTQRTRHLNILYFLVLDRIKKNEVHVQYCPTHNILADYFTKPLQGATFQIFTTLS